MSHTCLSGDTEQSLSEHQHTTWWTSRRPSETTGEFPKARERHVRMLSEKDRSNTYIGMVSTPWKLAGGRTGKIAEHAYFWAGDYWRFFSCFYIFEMWFSIICNRSQQTFSGKGQIVSNNLSCAGHRVPVQSTQLCHRARKQPQTRGKWARGRVPAQLHCSRNRWGLDSSHDLPRFADL